MIAYIGIFIGLFIDDILFISCDTHNILHIHFFLAFSSVKLHLVSKKRGMQRSLHATRLLLFYDFRFFASIRAVLLKSRRQTIAIAIDTKRLLVAAAMVMVMVEQGSGMATK